MVLLFIRKAAIFILWQMFSDIRMSIPPESTTLRYLRITAASQQRW